VKSTQGEGAAFTVELPLTPLVEAELEPRIPLERH
jgi:hypothetical protein